MPEQIDDNKKPKWKRVLLLAVSDGFVRTLFDHMRNIGIVGLVLASALHMYRIPVQSHFALEMVRLGFLTALLVLAFCLMLLNTVHVYNRLQEIGASRRFAGWYTGVLDFLTAAVLAFAVTPRG
jgi:hypothetical protein